MADLRIFSYLPNPRIYKATVAARYCDVDIELRSATPRELVDWLWDFDARPLRCPDEEECLVIAHRGCSRRTFESSADSISSNQRQPSSNPLVASL